MLKRNALWKMYIFGFCMDQSEAKDVIKVTLTKKIQCSLKLILCDLFVSRK